MSALRATHEAPKPYRHPLRTLSGGLVSAHRAHDHRRHEGLQTTVDPSPAFHAEIVPAPGEEIEKAAGEHVR